MLRGSQCLFEEDHLCDNSCYNCGAEVHPESETWRGSELTLSNWSKEVHLATFPFCRRLEVQYRVAYESQSPEAIKN